MSFAPPVVPPDGAVAPGPTDTPVTRDAGPDQGLPDLAAPVLVVAVAAAAAIMGPAASDAAAQSTAAPESAASDAAAPDLASSDLASSDLAAQDSAAVDPVPPAASNSVVDAFYLLQNAEALYQCRLRDRLHLGANELGAMRVIFRLTALGLDARALDVSRSLGVTSGATSVILGHLVTRGYLTRTANPRDGRGKLLHLSDEATAVVSHSLDDHQSDLSLLVSGMSPRDAKRVVGLLTAVTSSLDRSGHPDA